MPHLVLVNPQIPPNTGNIARTCAATKTDLHLVKPLGFEITDRYLKRAGLDYWPYVKLHIHESIEDLLEIQSQQHSRWVGFTVRGASPFQDFSFAVPALTILLPLYLLFLLLQSHSLSDKN